MFLTELRYYVKTIMELTFLNRLLSSTSMFSALPDRRAHFISPVVFIWSSTAMVPELIFYKKPNFYIFPGVIPIV